MPVINAKIQKLEKRIESKPSYGDYLALALRHYESYRLGNVTGLHKALHTAVTGYRENESCIWFLLACIFLHTENGNLDSASEFLATLKQYRNYYKNNNPLVFALYIYLNALYDMKSGKKNLKRYIKQLNDIDSHSAYIELMLGDVCLRSGDLEQSFTYLENYYEKGGRSFYFYLLCDELYQHSGVGGNPRLMVAYMKWAAGQGILDSEFIYDNSETIADVFYDYSEEFSEIYGLIGSDTLLYLICAKAVNERDLSKKAFDYYKTAEKKQLAIYGIEELLVICAFLYGEEDLRVHTLHMFLSQYELSAEIMPFVFHLLLSHEEFNHFAEEFDLSQKIMQYGAYALHNNAEGRIHNSIYKYMLDNLDGQFDLEESLAAAIYSQLFLFSIEVKGVDEGVIYLYEEEKQGMETYEFTNGKAKVKSATGNIRPIIMNKVTKSIENVPYTIARQVENVYSGVFEYFIDKGYDDSDLYIAAADMYLSSMDFDEKYVDILNKTLENKALSKRFYMEVSAALGNILSVLKRHDQALDYFNRVDANQLDERYIETMLIAFINAGDYTKALGLIIKKREFLGERTLLWALKQLAIDKSTHNIIADPAYELIIKNWYDARLLDVVINHYKGGNEDWFALRQALSGINVYDLDLDKKILANSLWVHDFSAEAQAVFHRLYKTEPESQLIADYLYYACFEALVEDKRPEYELISDMEKRFEETQEHILAYALGKIYLKFNIATFNSEEILAEALIFMEQDSVIIPEFKDAKDKRLISAYIEKNQPFIYRSEWNKRVVLYYKIGKAKEYEKKVMKHFAFGIFTAIMPVFYNEEVSYFISEEMDKGSISTAETVLAHRTPNLKPNASDPYFRINNALIYDQMFKYDEAEKIITELITSGPKIRGKII